MDQELNGKYGVLFDKLRHEIRLEREYNKQMWEAHDNSAKEFREIIGRGNGLSLKTMIAIIVAVITILAFSVTTLNSVVSPIRLQIGGMSDRMVRIEGRIESQISYLDEKLQIEVHQVEANSQARAAEDKEDIERILEWQKLHDDRYPPKWLIDKVQVLEDGMADCNAWRSEYDSQTSKIDATQSTKIDAIWHEIEQIRELFKIRDENIKKLVQ